MTSYDDRQLARLLRDEPRAEAEPPPALLPRLLRDIPTSLPLAPSRDGLDAPFRTVPLGSRVYRPAWIAAAASLVMVIGGGLLAWRVVREAPEPSLQMAAGSPEAADAAASPVEQVPPSAPAEVTDALRSLGYLGDETASRGEMTTDEVARVKAELAAARAAAGETETEEPGAGAGAGAEQAAASRWSSEFEAAAAPSPAVVDEDAQPAGRVAGLVADAAPAAPRAAQQAVEVPAALPPPAPPVAARVAPPTSAPRDDARAVAEGAARPPASPPALSRERQTRAAPPAAPVPEAAEREAVIAEAVGARSDEGLADSKEGRVSSFRVGYASGSYERVRRALEQGRLPAAGEVRVEELVDAFDYGDPPPRQGDFALRLEGGPSPWAGAERSYLLRVAVRAREDAGAAVVAAEARAQVEFDPRHVARWRLLGLEERRIGSERFRADAVVAGAVRAGATFNAVYEVELQPGTPASAAIALLRLRWLPAGTSRAAEAERVLRAGELAPHWEAASRAFRLAVTAARFGELLRVSTGATDLLALARRAEGLVSEWPGEERVRELARLVAVAAELRRRGAR